MSSVLFEIKGKNSSSAAIKQAQQELGGLEGSFNKIQGAVKAFVGLAAIKAVGDIANKTMEAFKAQQTAIALLTQATNNNANLTVGSLQRIITYTNQVQKSSIFGDDELQKQATYLASLQLTEDQIKKVLNASVQMASAGVMPLESAVSTLAKTYSGVGGTLAKQMPQFAALTAEQLKAGSILNKEAGKPRSSR